jgi:hypothetical protein
MRKKAIVNATKIRSNTFSLLVYFCEVQPDSRLRPHSLANQTHARPGIAFAPWGLRRVAT